MNELILHPTGPPRPLHRAGQAAGGAAGAGGLAVCWVVGLVVRIESGNMPPGAWDGPT